jgi:hypothetical protein
MNNPEALTQKKKNNNNKMSNTDSIQNIGDVPM